MRRHVARAQQCHTSGHRRRDDGVRIHSVLEEFLPEREALFVVTHDDGDDRRLRVPYVEAELAEALHHEARIVPKALDVLGLLLHDFERGHRGHDVRGGQGGGKDEGPGGVLDPVDDVLVARDEAAERGKALREGAHRYVDIIQLVEMDRRAAAAAEDTDGVCIVHVQPRAVFAAKWAELGQVDDIASHGEDSVHHDEDAAFLGDFLENALELIEVAVDEALHLAVAELAAIHDRGMVVLVRHDDVVSAYKAGNRAEVRLHPR